MEDYQQSTFYIDSDHPEIISFSNRHGKNAKDDLQLAIQLYYAVRDKIRYNPYSIDPDKHTMKASQVLEKKEGYCVAKAVLLAACLRSQGIRARLGFANVRNHVTTGRLKEMMGTDLFVWHGYTDIFLEGKWVKATPAFNLSLCEAFHIKPLEFNGREDSIFHPFDTLGNRHMEYVQDHGSFSDLPWERIVEACVQAYPKYFKELHPLSPQSSLSPETNDFEAEARGENPEV